MSTELDNQKNLDIELQPTEETKDDLENLEQSETDMKLNNPEELSELNGGDSDVNIEKENQETVETIEELREEDSLDDSEIEEIESLGKEKESDSTASQNSSQNNSELENELNTLKTQLEKLEAENQSIQGQYMRLNADFENYRRRTTKEKEDTEERVKMKTLSEILSVVDNFERARTQLKPSDDGEMVIHKSYQGVYKTLVDSLKRLGVSAMRPEGEPFDPNYHEAMLREPTNEHPEGTVLEQLVRGYLLKDKVLRHAMVKVATPKDEADSAQEEESPESQAEE